jgi:GGDEF domain-containing protein
MDDFRSQLTAVIDDLLARDVEPVFMVIDLPGAEQIKKDRGHATFDHFRESVMGAITSAGGGCDAFSYGDERIVAILGGFDRLKTFAMAEKLRRGLPFLVQSFDLPLQPYFDILAYDPATGVAGLVHQLVSRPRRDLMGQDVAS